MNAKHTLRWRDVKLGEITIQVTPEVHRKITTTDLALVMSLASEKACEALAHILAAKEAEAVH